MSARHPSEEIQLLLSDLETIEAALGAHREALGALVDDFSASSMLGDLEEARSALRAVADDIVRKIEEQVETASARAVFAGRAMPVDIEL